MKKKVLTKPCLLTGENIMIRKVLYDSRFNKNSKKIPILVWVLEP